MPWSAGANASRNPPDVSRCRHPLVHEPGILPGADVSSVVDPARESEVVERAAPTFKPSKDARAGRFKKLELDGSASFTLDDDRAGANPAATDEVADPDLDDVAAAQLAVDREVEHRSVSDPSLAVEPEADGPDLLRFERALCAELPTCVPRPAVFEARIILGMSHSPVSPPAKSGQGRKTSQELNVRIWP